MTCEGKTRANATLAPDSCDSLQPPKILKTSFEEQHFTVAQVAKIWSLSEDAVRRLFCKEPGVLVLEGRSKGRKRRYTTLRIPQSVLERVHRQYSLYCK